MLAVGASFRSRKFSRVLDPNIGGRQPHQRPRRGFEVLGTRAELGKSRVFGTRCSPFRGCRGGARRRGQCHKVASTIDSPICKIHHHLSI